jgi:predicted ArsR family transcriptional regulator
MIPSDSGTAIRAVAALADSLRQDLYQHIRAARTPVTREEAAAAVGISRKLAAFHLDKLVEAGLLRARYAAGPAGQRKVGRRPKLYEPADVDIAVSLPERQHDLLAGILVDAVREERAGQPARESALRVAHERGRAVAAAERERLHTGRLGAERALSLSETLLNRHGYLADRISADCLSLRNCPFHPVVEQDPDLVCGINHAFLDGMLAGLEVSSVQAVLKPRPGECCVQLHKTTAAPSGG